MDRPTCPRHYRCWLSTWNHHPLVIALEQCGWCSRQPGMHRNPTKSPLSPLKRHLRLLRSPSVTLVGIWNRHHESKLLQHNLDLRVWSMIDLPSRVGEDVDGITLRNLSSMDIFSHRSGSSQMRQSPQKLQMPSSSTCFRQSIGSSSWHLRYELWVILSFASLHVFHMCFLLHMILFVYCDQSII